jgi:hypothetical protein
MGFTIFSYFVVAGSQNSAVCPDTSQWSSVERVRWGIRACAAPASESAGQKVTGIDTEATNHCAAGASVENLSAAVAAVADGNRLRAASPEGFTAPGASRSQSAYDLAPLILQEAES